MGFFRSNADVIASIIDRMEQLEERIKVIEKQQQSTNAVLQISLEYQNIIASAANDISKATKSKVSDV